MENIYTQHTELGREIVRARRLSGAESAALQLPLGKLLYYVLIPLFFAPFLAFMGGGLLPLALIRVGWVAAGSPAAMAAFAAGAIPVYMLCLWQLYCLPRRDQFIVHERGLRIRVGLRCHALRYEQITKLMLGRQMPGWERALTSINRVANPGVAELAARVSGQALTLRLANGRRLVLRHVLAKFVAEDLE